MKYFTWALYTQSCTAHKHYMCKMLRGPVHFYWQTKSLLVGLAECTNVSHCSQTPLHPVLPLQSSHQHPPSSRYVPGVFVSSVDFNSVRLKRNHY